MGTVQFAACLGLGKIGFKAGWEFVVLKGWREVLLPTVEGWIHGNIP